MPYSDPVKQKQAELEWRVRRRKVIDDLKDVPCADCGRRFPPYVMDFDHRDPSQKKIAISRRRTNVSLARILEEIANCDVVCANCHRIRTHK